MYAVIKKYVHDSFQKISVLCTALLGFALPVITFAQANGGGGGGNGGGGGFFGVPDTLEPMYWVSMIAEFIYDLMGWITAKMGEIMNWTIEFFILNMSEQINSISAIESLWQILRDLGNIIFIFLILYAAISTILGSNEHGVRKLLPRIIVVALLVNFSLFATQFIVDTSNVFALQIYENIQVSGVNSSSGVNLSNAIMNQTNLTTVMSGEGLDAVQESTDEHSKVALLYLLSAGVTGIMGFVFAAFAALVTIRFFVLMLLMIASPIAFIAFAIPDVEFGNTWMDYLLRQSFFAPAMMLMLYLTLVLGKSMRGDLFSGTSDLAQAIIKPSGNIDILIFFALMVGMLIATLIVARRIGAVGADKAIGGTAAAYGWAGRQTIGRAGRAVQNSRFLKEKATDEDANAVSRYLAQKTLKGGQKTADSSFDVRNTSAASVVDSEGGSLDSSFGQREGGYNEIREEEREFLEQQREDLAEMTPSEKERAAKAKVRKKEEKDYKDDVEEKIDDINQFEEKRNSLLSKLADAMHNNNDQKGKQMFERLKDLEDEASDEIEQVEDLFAQDLQAMNYSNISDVNQDLDKTDDLDRAKTQSERAKEEFERRIESLNKIIKVGEERSERFQEILSEQQSNLDYIASKAGLDTAASRLQEAANQASDRLGQATNDWVGGDDIFLDPDKIRFTQRTQAFRDVAAEDIESIDNIGDDNRQQRTAHNLQGNI